MFPTRTARFGVALVTKGSVRLKSKEHATELGPVDPECRCSTCKNYSRAVLHVLFKEGNALAAQLLTKHNVSYMMRLMRTMRQVRSYMLTICVQRIETYSHNLVQAIMEGHEAHEAYVRNFFKIQFPAGDVPVWAVEALATADIHITTTLTKDSPEKKEEDAEGATKKAKIDGEDS